MFVICHRFIGKTQQFKRLQDTRQEGAFQAQRLHREHRLNFDGAGIPISPTPWNRLQRSLVDSPLPFDFIKEGSEGQKHIPHFHESCRMDNGHRVAKN